MTHRALPLLLSLLLVSSAFAQDRPFSSDRMVERVTTLAEEVRELADDLPASLDQRRMHRAADMLGDAASSIEEGESDDAEEHLDDASDVMEDVIDNLRDDGYDGRADRAVRLQRRVDDLQETLDDGWMREGRYENGRRIDSDGEGEESRTRREERYERMGERWEERGERWADEWEEKAEEWDDGRWRDRMETRWERRREDENRFRSYAPMFVGDFGDRWPFPETAAYRTAPSVRHTRVDGTVLGFRVRPLDWDDYDRARAYGHVSRAFGSDSWRYEVGGEARLGESYRLRDFDFKVGGAYRRETATNDLWKSNWAENSAGSFFFRTDLFDYYQTEGFTLYSVLRATPALQATVAYRSDDYSSLSRNVTWSLFGGNDFRPNPRIDEGRMQSLVVALDGGRVQGLRWIPSGIAFRAEAEFGESFGGDFSFNRYLGDVRAYLRPGRDTGLALRVRGGQSDGELVPFQKTFTIGGAGSVRAYPQNAFRGTSMLLANAEFTLYDVDLLDDLLSGVSFFGLFDAGWVDGPNQRDFEMDDVLSAAGFGVGLADRQLRLEVAWPLKNIGTGMEPSVWLRLIPTF